MRSLSRSLRSAANVASEMARSLVISRAAFSTSFASGSSLLERPSVSAIRARMSSSVTPKSRPILT